jgi:hypothetical protein
MVLFLLKSVRNGVVFQGESSTQLELNPGGISHRPLILPNMTSWKIHQL